MRLAAVVSSVLLAALAGCGGSGDGGEARGLERYEVANAGFALSVPADWKTIDKLDEQTVDAFAEENPDFEPFLRMATQTDALQFISFDPEIEEQFATNVNVIVTPIPRSLNLDQWVDENLRTLQGVPSADIGEPTPTDLPAGPAVRLTWSYQIQSQGQSRRVHADQYFVRKGEKAFVITFTTLPDRVESYRDTFSDSARSFEFR